MRAGAKDEESAPGATTSAGPRRRSRAGLWLCVLYLATTCACMIMSLDENWDAKSRFLLLQLPIVFQSAAAFSLGLYPFIDRFPTWIPYVLMLLIGFGILYGIGCVFGEARFPGRPGKHRSRQAGRTL